MSKTDEITILETGNIKITNLRAGVGKASYPISNIMDVRVTKGGSTSGCLVVPLVSIGISMALCAIASDIISLVAQSENLLIAAFTCISSALVLAVRPKPNYTIQISGPFGDLKILQSNDKNYLQSVVDAINVAILYEASGRSQKSPRLPGNPR